MLFRERSLKEILFGKHVALSREEQNVLQWIRGNPGAFKAAGGRTGQFVKVDLVHKGIGTVYMLPNRLGDEKRESVVLFDEDTKIIPGPDLWLYLSSNENVKKDGLGEYLQLVLIKGNKGGQAYMIKKPMSELGIYKSVVIWCKQFSVLFTFAPLA